MKRECESCVKRKTTYCPNSSECYDTEEMPYYQNRIMLLGENQKLKEKYNKALELLVSYNLPCDIDNFNTKEDNLEYCSRNCSVDEVIFIKCWDRYIEQKLGRGK